MARTYKRRLKNYFINKTFQGKIVLALFLAVAVSGILFLALFGVLSADTMTITYENNNLQMGNTPAMLLKKAVAANWIFLVTCGSILIIIAIIGTHRIAGPLFRFEKAMDSMVRKDLRDTITLREKDEGKNLALQINLFNATLSHDLRELKRRSHAIRDLYSQYSSLKNTSLSPEDVDSICTAIKSNADKMDHILSAYKLADE